MWVITKSAEATSQIIFCLVPRLILEHRRLPTQSSTHYNINMMSITVPCAHVVGRKLFHERRNVIHRLRAYIHISKFYCCRLSSLLFQTRGLDILSVRHPTRGCTVDGPPERCLFLLVETPSNLPQPII
jgi:hypothetical protein